MEELEIHGTVEMVEEEAESKILYEIRDDIDKYHSKNQQRTEFR